MFCSLSIQVENRVVLIVGGGSVGLRRARFFEKAGARIRVVSLSLLDDFSLIAKEVHIGCYHENYLDDVSFVVAATSNDGLNRSIAADARNRGIWVNNASDRTDCDFHIPAIVDYDHLSIAISSEGKDLEGVLTLKKRLQEFLHD